MSDIFISYKREDQAVARKLANALESEGWTVWWDPKLRAGDDFDKIIEAVLNESRCVVVLWSKLSLQSDYVRAEASEALEKKKLVPVAIENVSLPFRFKRLHTPKLLNWEGSSESAEFRKLVDDITAIIGSPKRKRETRRTRSRPSITTDNRKPGKGGSTVEPQKRKLEPRTIFRDKLKDGSQGLVEAEEHYKVEDGLRELFEALEITTRAFRVQNRKRDDLVSQLLRRLGGDDKLVHDHGYMVFFARVFKEMNDGEKLRFREIRTITDGPMRVGNEKTLAVLKRNPHLLKQYPQLAPKLKQLRTHLEWWLDRYNDLFLKSDDMCLLYTGAEEDRMGYPRGLYAEIEEALANAQGKRSS